MTRKKVVHKEVSKYMLKLGRIIICSVLVVGIAGCTRDVNTVAENSSPSPTLSPVPSASPIATQNTEDNNVQEEIDGSGSSISTAAGDYPEPATVPANSTRVYSQSTGPRGWFIYSSQVADEASLFTFYSKDKGNSWNSAQLTLNKDMNQQINKENIFVSVPKEEQGPVWLLITSDPGAGLMKKLLYRSADEMKSWSLAADVSNKVDGYVTGVSFADHSDGWITASYHGEVSVPLYHTSDGGKNWDLQEIAVPEGFKYGNVYPPVFDSKNVNKGSLKIEFVGDKETKTFEYKTVDLGKHWGN